MPWTSVRCPTFKPGMDRPRRRKGSLPGKRSDRRWSSNPRLPPNSVQRIIFFVGREPGWGGRRTSSAHLFGRRSLFLGAFQQILGFFQNVNLQGQFPDLLPICLELILESLLHLLRVSQKTLPTVLYERCDPGLDLAPAMPLILGTVDQRITIQIPCLPPQGVAQPGSGPGEAKIGQAPQNPQTNSPKKEGQEFLTPLRVAWRRDLHTRSRARFLFFFLDPRFTQCQSHLQTVPLRTLTLIFDSWRNKIP